MSASFWASQSPFSDPGSAVEVLTAIDALPSDIAALRDAASNLCLHYTAFKSKVIPARRAEIHTMYADVMFPRILSRGEPATFDWKRSPDERTVGCCRDSTLLLLSMLRRKGIPARARVGSSAYFNDKFMVDHVVAEVWDASQERWRLVDPDVPSDFPKQFGKPHLDLTDLRSGIDFQTAPQAWALVRAGKADPSKYIITPELDIRGLHYIAVNVVHDLASMNKNEMLQWDLWGMELRMENAVADLDLLIIDEISSVLTDPNADPETLAKLISRPDLAVPEKVVRFDPNAPEAPPQLVDISRTTA